MTLMLLNSLKNQPLLHHLRMEELLQKQERLILFLISSIRRKMVNQTLKVKI
jgi:hypothetical protein